MKYLMGIDEGTTGCRACLFNEAGELISSATREYQSYYPHPGWVEQDIGEIENCVFDACKTAISTSGIDPQDVVGVSHSNQGITMVLLDENDLPVLDRTIGWQDLRHAEILDELRESIDTDAYWNVSGMDFGTYNISVLNWIQEKMPDTWSKVRRICSHQDYFLKRYGAKGYFIDEGSANFLSMANMITGEWDEALMSVFGVDETMLPTVVHEPGKVVGHVSEEISDLTGLPVGCNVCLGGLDTNSCALGAGAKGTGTQTLIMGTAGVSLLISDRMVTDPNRRITVRRNPGFGNWQYYIMTNTGASSFRWFRDELCSMEVATSKLMGVDPYDIITSTASHSTVGANGVLALTGFQGSHTRVKNENARGTLFGINLGTSKADIAQAILEGICFEMKDIIIMNEELAGKVKTIRLCGGVTKSDSWCQMFSDILDAPVELTNISELGSLGAAMCAGVGAGVFASLDAAIEKCVKVKQTYTPQNENKNAYEDIFLRWSRLNQIAVELVY